MSSGSPTEPIESSDQTEQTRQGEVVQLKIWELDRPAGLRPVGGDPGPRAWSLAFAQVGPDLAAVACSAALGRSAAFSLAGAGTSGSCPNR